MHYRLREPWRKPASGWGRMRCPARSSECSCSCWLLQRTFHNTTDSCHRFYKDPSLFKGHSVTMTATQAEHVCLDDMSHVPAWEHGVHLSLGTSAYSRKAVGHHVYAHLQTEEVAEALNDGVTPTSMKSTSDSSLLSGAACGLRTDLLNDRWL